MDGSLQCIVLKSGLKISTAENIVVDQYRQREKNNKNFVTQISQVKKAVTNLLM